MRAVLAAASGPGGPAFLIVQNHSDAIYKHPSWEKMDWSCSSAAWDKWQAQSTPSHFWCLHLFLFFLFVLFFFFAFGQRQVAVLIKYFACFKCTINALSTSATTRNVLSWDEFLSLVHISVILVVQLLKYMQTRTELLRGPVITVSESHRDIKVWSKE